MFAIHVTKKTLSAETFPPAERNAPIATAVSAGTGGNTFSIPARIPTRA
jgi:hypothetical protein